MLMHTHTILTRRRTREAVLFELPLLLFVHVDLELGVLFVLGADGRAVAHRLALHEAWAIAASGGVGRRDVQRLAYIVERDCEITTVRGLLVMGGLQTDRHGHPSHDGATHLRGLLEPRELMSVGRCAATPADWRVCNVLADCERMIYSVSRSWSTSTWRAHGEHMVQRAPCASSFPRAI